MTDSKPSKAPASQASAKAQAASKAPASKAPSKAPATSKAAASKAPAAPKPPAAAAPPSPPTHPAPPVPQPYAQQPYGGAGYQPNMGPRTNALAIISLVSSLTGLIIPFLAPIAGIITGHLALGQIKRTGEAGRGLALAGTIIGYALIGLTVLVVLFYLLFFVALFSSGVLTTTTVI